MNTKDVGISERKTSKSSKKKKTFSCGHGQFCPFLHINSRVFRKVNLENFSLEPLPRETKLRSVYAGWCQQHTPHRQTDGQTGLL